MDSYISVNQECFLFNGSPVMLKSMGLGSWLNLEHLMVGIPGTHSQIKQVFDKVYGVEKANLFWEKYYTLGVTEADIKFLKNKGFNSVRLAVAHALFYDHAQFEQTTAIRHIDRVLEYCARHGIWAIIDLHTTPGGQNPDWHSDNHSGDYGFWKNEQAQGHMEELWFKIARYYQNNTVVAGYDLLNEPCYFEKEIDKVLLSFYERVTRKIRSVDTNHIIFYEGNTYSRDFSMFKGNMDENCAYTFHFYPFLQIPELIKNENLKTVIKAQMQHDITIRHIREVLKRPVWCGETGHPHYLRNTNFALKTFLEILEEENISWALWPYKDNGAMGYVHLKYKSEWNRTMMKLSGNWNFFDFFKQDSALAIQDETDKMKYYRDMADFSSRGLEIFAVNLISVPFDTIYGLLDDFIFENLELPEE